MQKVLVTGATGRTGSLVLGKLARRYEQFKAIGFVQSPQKASKILGDAAKFVCGDIRQQTTLDSALVGCNSLVILTSATPQMLAPPKPGERPQFYYPEDASPEIIDFQGQKNQIDAAINAGIEHIVLVGSMGGTNPEHPLNKMGNGNILIWKRRAEQYLVDSGINYTIIRAGGLLNDPGGKRELLVGKNDEMLTNSPEGINPAVPREDVAEVVVQALLNQDARNKAFDLISKPETASKNSITRDFVALFDNTTAGM